MSKLRKIFLDEAFYRQKVSQIQARLDQVSIDGLLLLDTSNVIYASGFFHIPSERPLGFFIPVTGEPVLFVPLLEMEHAQDTWIADIRTYFEYPGDENPVQWMVRESGAERLAVDSLSHGLYVQLVGMGVDIAITTLVQEMRWVKSAREIALVEQAAHYADYCLQIVRDTVADIFRQGGCELDVLNVCLADTRDKMQRELGDIFDLYGGSVVGTVHSGPRGALPHGRPNERRLQPGDTLIAGIGAKVGGYHAESGATFILGEPTADQMRCLKAAADCNDAAVEACLPGQTCAQVNSIALSVLKDAGLASYIRHRIGHGMGLQGHEGPWLAPGDHTQLVAGMVFSNEPGIYRPNVDGYRTINSMVVTDGSARVVSRFLAENPPEQRIILL